MRRTPWHEWQHPRDPEGKFTDEPAGWARRAAQQVAQAFTDAELIERERHVNSLIEQNRHLDTSRVHRPNGRWTAERAAQQRALVDQVWARKARRVPSDRHAIMTGGLMGAGKTTVLNGPAGVDLSQYLTVSADDMKEEMIRRGMVPSIPGRPDLAPMELSALFHVESAFLADMLMERAVKAGKNVIVDASMGDKQAPLTRVRRLREAGYSVDAIFVDIPVDTSLERASARYRWGMREWATGRGPGGRTIPPALIVKQRGSGGQTVNRRVFEEMIAEGVFDETQAYDNTGDAPRRTDQ